MTLERTDLRAALIGAAFALLAVAACDAVSQETHASGGDTTATAGTGASVCASWEMDYTEVSAYSVQEFGEWEPFYANLTNSSTGNTEVYLRRCASWE